MKEWIKEYFTFTEKEQRGIAILLGLIFLSAALRYLAPIFSGHTEYDNEAFRMQVKQFLSDTLTIDVMDRDPKTGQNMIGEYQSYSMNEVMFDPFYFDPNKLDDEGWKKTGLSEKVIRNILRYRKKGGVFRSAEDVRKIYGMEDSAYYKIAPYLVFANTIKADRFEQHTIPSHIESHPADSSGTMAKKAIELNSADSAALVSLPGIGPGFASKILRYRDKLGGYVAREQLLEVKGLDSARFTQIKDLLTLDTAGIRKMDLNTVTFKTMLSHPYFEYYLVKAIFNYKDRVRTFDSVGQLRNIETIYPELYDKIIPYLTVGPKSYGK
jgi:DNA uptake protein ComE-like DNA-binding protein